MRASIAYAVYVILILFFWIGMELICHEIEPLVYLSLLIAPYILVFIGLLIILIYVLLQTSKKE